MELIEDYLRNMDAQTSAEIVIFTIPSFIGHGIKKDAQEIQDRDNLANYLFNEVSLDGIKGIGKKDKAYNDGVRDYNLHIRTFPNNVFNENGFLGAKAWAYKQYPQYEASAEIRNIVPQVNLNLTG